eukprot:CAMPEP_0115829422 /NCGR_PEP_ID=MMETSP0287-20121206/1090_1 /TAXON_ID=412157 /ORGANISM="Chrysochromulina rotalis, Strain UIO044" /LENGTH=160 /DNA_ID=CAMNT_0003282687 /DNA_START=73 /DNA_END=550 /DNA_ORIENTATION=-
MRQLHATSAGSVDLVLHLCCTSPRRIFASWRSMRLALGMRVATMATAVDSRGRSLALLEPRCLHASQPALLELRCLHAHGGEDAARRVLPDAQQLIVDERDVEKRGRRSRIGAGANATGQAAAVDRRQLAATLRRRRLAMRAAPPLRRRTSARRGPQSVR